MAYTKHEFQSGEKLYAAQLNEMDEQIAKNEEELVKVSEEIAKHNLEKVFFTGDDSLMTKENEVILKIEFTHRGKFISCWAKVKWQGNSSLSYDKKNFTVKLYKDAACTEKLYIDIGFGLQNKYNLKANFIDHSHARNVVSARLWADIVRSRPDFNSLPEEMRNAPNLGAIDGFAIKLYMNGVYQGLYTWNIPKDGWMFNMNEDNPNHCVLCAEGNNNGDMTLEMSTQFRRHSIFADQDGEWVCEFPDDMNEARKTSFNALIDCVKDTDDATFKATLQNHADVQSLIDYYLYSYFMCHLDGLAQNMIMMTYDGVHWLASMYDMDSTWGLFVYGDKFVSAEYKCPEQYQENNSLMWKRLETVFVDELKARYAELRNGPLSLTNIIRRFEGFTDLIPAELYAEDKEIYTDIPSADTNNIKQIRSYAAARAAYVDDEMFWLGEERAEYTPLNYIESNGTQYINTGYVPNKNTHVEVDAVWPYANGDTIFGVDNYFKLVYTDSNVSYLYAFKHNQGAMVQNGYTGLSAEECNKRHTYGIDMKSTTWVNIDGKEINNGTTAPNTSDIVNEKAMLLLAEVSGTGAAAWSLATAKLYGAKIYESGVLIHNYIPVLDGDGVACLYDTITHEFKHNAGTGVFVAGETT